MTYFRYISLLFILPLLCGCSDETDIHQLTGDGEGRLQLGQVTVDMSTTDGQATTRAGFTAPTADQLTCRLTCHTTGTVSERVGTPESAILQTGSYTLEVYYGEEKMSQTPYLYAKRDFDITQGATTTISDLTVGLACAVIRPNLSASLLEQYQGAYTLSLSDGDNILTVVNGTDYFVPAGQDYTLLFAGTNMLGEQSSFSTPVSNAACKTRYILNYSPNLPTFTLPAQVAEDAWSKRIYITPLTVANIEDAKGTPTDKLLNNMVYEVSADGTNWIQAVTENGRLVAKGLEPSKAYTIRARFVNVTSNNTYQLTTEADAGVPNGDFEDLVQTISTTMKQGGAWSPTIAKPDYQTSATFTISEPTGWTSINSITCNLSANNVNTWFTIPSTFNTTLSWISNGGESLFKDEATPSTYSNLTAYSGNNAMVVRNVAWDLNGTTPSTDRKTGNRWNRNVPTIANRSAGQLTWNGGFTSRPAFINGFYKYVQDSQDTGECAVITVNIYGESDETLIASCSKQLNSVSDYTPFQISLNYNEIRTFAKKLSIFITSSQRTENIQTSTHLDRHESASWGAVLTIDNLTFTYE